MCSKTFGLIQLYLKGRLEIFVYDVENFLLFLSTTATFQHCLPIFFNIILTIDYPGYCLVLLPLAPLINKSKVC